MISPEQDAYEAFAAIVHKDEPPAAWSALPARAREAWTAAARAARDHDPRSASLTEDLKQRLILLFLDPETRECEVHVPIPKGGVPKVHMPEGARQGILDFGKMTHEQLAYHVFWSGGTRDRVDELVKNGRGAGLRQTIRWLVGMRVAETVRLTGYRYELEIVTKREVWERRKT